MLKDLFLMVSVSFRREKKMFMRHELAGQIVECTAAISELEDAAMLFLTAYAFQLRLPSEALPIIKGKDNGSEKEQAVICV